MERFAKAYEVLGLKPNADLALVKSTYRRLALRLHPDINPDPKANEKFLVVQKAYEVILEADKHAGHWQGEAEKHRTPKEESRTGRPSRKEAMKQARERAQRFEEAQIRKEARQYMRFKKTIFYPWTMAMAYLSFIMFSLILIDAFWLGIAEHGYVTKKEAYESSMLGLNQTKAYRFHFGDGETLELSSDIASRITEGNYISYRQSVIFGDIPYIYRVDEDFSESRVDAFGKPPHLFFLLFIFVPVLVLIVDRPSAVFYSAGAFGRYGVLFFILAYIIF